MEDETIEIRQSALRQAMSASYDQGRAEALAEVAPKLAGFKAHADAMAAALIEFEKQDGWPRTVTGRDFAAVHKALDAYRKWLEEGK